MEKLDSGALRCVFVGHSPSKRDTSVSILHLKSCFVSQDVTFHEDEPYFTQSYLRGEDFNVDKIETLELPGLYCIKSNACAPSSLESNTPNLSDFESNRPNVSGFESNTFVLDPSKAKELGVESNQSNSPAVKLESELHLKYGNYLVYIRT